MPHVVPTVPRDAGNRRTFLARGPTVLVREASLRLVDVPQAHRWNGRGYFFAAAAELMRRILIENARRKQCLRRGGLRRLALDTVNPGRKLGMRNCWRSMKH